MTRRLAVVPARGGSKRIPMKNVRDFCGKPMIAHILEAARSSGLFDVIHVSTESDAVRSVVERLGFGVDFLRPDHLADDHTPIMPVLKFVADSYAERDMEFDEVWLLMACAPFIESVDLQQAAKVMAGWKGERPVLAVAPYPVPVEWAYDLAPDGALTPLNPGMFAIRSQDIAPKYFDTGTFAAFPAAMVRASSGAGSDAAFVGFALEKDKAVDIDDEADWRLAGSMFTHRQNLRSPGNLAGSPEGPSHAR